MKFQILDSGFQIPGFPTYLWKSGLFDLTLNFSWRGVIIVVYLWKDNIIVETNVWIFSVPRGQRIPFPLSIVFKNSKKKSACKMGRCEKNLDRYI